MKAPSSPPKPASLLPPLAALLLVILSSVLSLLHLQAEEIEPPGGNTGTVQGAADPLRPNVARADTPPGFVDPYIKLTIRLIIAPNPLPKEDTYLSEAEMMNRLRELSQIKGVSLLALPTTTLRPNQPSIIKSIREAPNSGGGPNIADDGTILRPFSGIIVQSNAVISSEAELVLNSRISFSLTPGKPLNLLTQPDGVDWDNLKSWQSECIGIFSEPGHTLRVYMGEISPGQHQEAFITPAPVDETGRPTKDFSPCPEIQAEPIVLSRATLRARLIELPLSAEDQMKENLESSSYASPRQEIPLLTRKTIGRWKTDARVTITELEPVHLTNTGSHPSAPSEPAPPGPWRTLPDVVPLLRGPFGPGEPVSLYCTAPAIPPYEPGEVVGWDLYGFEDRDWLLKLPSPDPDWRRLLVLSLSEIETGPFNNE